jgi:Ca2+-binding EF-hand superfamily protein
MMQVFDSNDDHVLSKKEVSNVLQLLTGLDMNGDGRITAEEMSEEAIMTVAPRFADDKQRAMAKAAEMKKGTQGSAGAQRTP